jgi:hypothetical protein
MALTVHTVLLLIAAILFVISSLGVTSPVDLFKLGWAFVALAFVF